MTLLGDTTVYHQRPQMVTNAIMKFPMRQFVSKSVRTILFWTTFFREPFNLENNRRCLATCPYKCEVTNDKAKISEADAVLFHLSDLWPSHWRIGTKSMVEMPTYRRPEQVWVVTNMEPPPHHWGDLKILNSVFNWTAWYRRDSDIYMPYGNAYLLNATERILAERAEKGRNYFREKTKTAALRIGNCFDPGRRYVIVKELEKYLPIDKYGKCYDNLCGDSAVPGDETCEKIIAQYKFYIAFENSNCRDYITEKYWMTLKRNQIPIVNWKGFDYDKIAIPGSYINVHDFDSLEDLGKFLQKVSTNDSLYNSFFRYKINYANKPSVCAICQVCRNLHHNLKPAKVYVDLDAWVRDDTCDKVEVWNNFMKNVYGWRFKILGF